MKLRAKGASADDYIMEGIGGDAGRNKKIHETSPFDSRKGSKNLRRARTQPGEIRRGN